MKAIVYRNYGSPDVLRLEEIEKPAPGEGEVLLKVRAASVNPYDWHFMRGLPYLVRLMAGPRKPKTIRLGADVAGVVEAVGGGVTAFKPGDEVFGAGQGAFAEFACAPASRLALKPQSVSFEQAASVPIAACTALQSLRDKCRIAPGQQVLVNGAAGGVGTFAVQIAKSYGAVVTAVCSGRNLELVRSIGADYAIDYTLEDFSRGGREYDAILDAVGNRGPSAFRRVMKPQGILAMAGGGSAGKWMIGPLLGMLHARLLSFGSRKFLGIFAKIDAPDLTFLGELMAAGKVTPVIDRRYPLSELPEAMRYVEEGHARGKVVIVVD